ncbi:hypothetical protein CIB95_01375 [Lottiidibacillus patelloidae]|uniref:DUF2268 domain-containing protein n=1 Tax=Lottiidibacillus patelloidae TaxID=2670334 RepID=A0A263BWX3_9BACI|nr:DUF2268 domain-containing putative Zn-dependent protease [Lottiidibacillus patelloidae]OZM58251.1 hypothetical protein CIB95_01375 [Lottiidibacillus patelloidae]
MNIVNTKKWLKDLDNSLENRSIFTSGKTLLHDKLIVPLTDYFPGVNSYEILEYLQSHGLFQTKDSNQISNFITFLTQKKVEKVVAAQLKKLKKEWNGPSVNVFLLPIDEGNTDLLKELGWKCGLGFSDKTFIFLSAKVSLKGLLAVITHEYHHVCRLKHSKKDLPDFSLLDSLLIEGLAEFAVEEYVGAKHLAPWCNRYNKKVLKRFWESTMKNNLNLIGKKNHHSFLYGNESKLPKWIGYSIGYDIVKSIIKQNTHYKTADLLNKKSEELLSLSTYKMK